ncbi:MAG: hypothetical protein CSA66_03820 [Proteobacteria bacterium]|nr:MAG: hypothetical protein CSA66_03820 [Pseudomonadota bacterium]
MSKHLLALLGLALAVAAPAPSAAAPAPSVAAPAPSAAAPAPSVAAPAPSAAAPAPSAGDARVRQALDAAGLSYTVTEPGEFRLVMSLQSGRSQVVLVTSRTYALMGVEIREIWSVANDYSAGIPVDDANQLLERNTGFKLGAFALRAFGEVEAAIFLAKVPATSRADAMRAAIWAVAYAADAAEADLSGQDRF